MQLGPESESTFTTLDLYEREALLVIDYSSVAAELGVRHETALAPNVSQRCRLITAHARPQALQTEEEEEAYLHRLREALASVEAMLYHTTAPNMKALEKLGELRDKFQDVAEGHFCCVDL